MTASEATSEDAAAGAGAAPSLRRGSRARQPTKKAEQASATDKEALQSIRTERASSRGRRSASKEIVGKERAHEDYGDAGTSRLDAVAEDEEQVEDYSQSKQPLEEVEEDVYCVCRGPDDGSPMVGCACCDGWFHFRCIGLNKEVAEALAEYVCADCSSKTGKVSQNIDGSSAVLDGTNASASSSSPKPAKRKPSVSNADGDPATKKRKPSLQSSSLARKASDPVPLPKGSPSTETSSSAQQSDAVRAHAVSHFESILIPLFTADQRQVAQVKRTAAGKRFANALETAMFETFAETVAGQRSQRGAQKAYKDRFRTLSFSLRDKRNDDLHARILSGDLTPATLASLPSDQLANAAMRAKTEKARQESLQQSILREQQGGPMRKMTHKGEVDIEHENAAPLHDNFTRTPVRARTPQTADSAIKDDEPSVEVDEAAAEPLAPLESTARREPASPPKASIKGTDSIDTDNLARVSIFDFTNVWGIKGGAPQEEDENGEQETRENENADGADGSEEQRDEEYNPVQASDDLIDNFLQGIGSPHSTRSVPGGESTTPRATPPISLPNAQDNPVLWRGAITMPDEVTVSGQVRQVGGSPLPKEQREAVAGNFFPSAHCMIQGRLPTKTACAYLEQSSASARTELLVFTMEKEFNLEALKSAPPPAPLTESSHDSAFEHILNYFSRKDRYGVLLPSSTFRGRIVKDLYVVPLLQEAPLPGWLESLDQSSFETERASGLLVFVAVVFTGAIDSWAASVEASSKAKKPASSDTVPGLPGTSSSALQDLLKAVGGGGDLSKASSTPPSQMPTPVLDPRKPPQSRAQQGPAVANEATSQSSDGAADAFANPNIAAVLGALEAGPNKMGSAGEGASEAANAASALSQVPSSDIESVLSSNPQLLSQLLQSLGGGGGGSGISAANDANSTGRPPAPGPPPSKPASALPPGPPPGPPPSRPPFTYGGNPYAADSFSTVPPQGQWAQNAPGDYYAAPSRPAMRGGSTGRPPMRGGGYGNRGGQRH